MLQILVTDARGLYTNVCAAGYTPLVAQFVIVDPEGYLLRFFENRT